MNRSKGEPMECKYCGNKELSKITLNVNDVDIVEEYQCDKCGRITEG